MTRLGMANLQPVRCVACCGSLRTAIYRPTNPELVHKLIVFLGKGIRYGLRKTIELGLGQATSKSRILLDDCQIREI